MNEYTQLALLYLFVGIPFLFTIDKISDQIKKSVKEYIKFMNDVPLKYSVGK